MSEIIQLPLQRVCGYRFYSGGRIWQRIGMLAGHLPIVVPNHDVRIAALCGEDVGVPPSLFVVFAMAVLAGDDLIPSH